MKCEHSWSYCNDKVYWCRLCGCLIAYKIIYVPAHHKKRILGALANGDYTIGDSFPNDWIPLKDARDAKKVK